MIDWEQAYSEEKTDTLENFPMPNVIIDGNNVTNYDVRWINVVFWRNGIVGMILREERGR